MATENPIQPAQLTEAEIFYQYLGERIANGSRDSTAADLLADFEEYYRQLQDLRAKLHEAEASSARGESKPLDLEELLQRTEKRWDEKGIPK